MDFAKAIPNFLYKIIVPRILPYRKLGESLFSFIILSPLIYYNEFMFFSKGKV
jgi:hypothetical protein